MSNLLTQKCNLFSAINIQYYWQFVFVTLYLINFALRSQEYSVTGKVLAGQNKYTNNLKITNLNNNKQSEDVQERKNLQESYDEYYEDSFEDLQTHNFVDEYELDGEVRFITEDDVEESYNDDAEEFAHTGSGIVNLYDPRCPDLPQPSKATELHLCQAKLCRNDEDCRHFSKSNGGGKSYVGASKNTFICCFNGCINACLLRMDPPKAFDWIEETEFKYVVNANGTSKAAGIYFPGSSTLNPKALLSDDDPTSDKISLPGGCFITQKQLEELRLFRKYDHVDTCTCLKGEVVCHINPKISFKSELLGSKLPI